MKISKYTEEQITYAVKQAKTWTKVEGVCLKMGIPGATFFDWKKKYGGLGTLELRRPTQPKEENRQLKKLVADLSQDKLMEQEVYLESYKASPEAAHSRQPRSAMCVSPAKRLDCPARFTIIGQGGTTIRPKRNWMICTGQKPSLTRASPSTPTAKFPVTSSPACTTLRRSSRRN